MSVANFIINKCYVDGRPISNLHLQYMLYYTSVEFYRQTKRDLFLDSICAWQFGPAVPEVYYKYCAYGGRPINISCETEIAEEDEKLLDNSVDKYINIPINILVKRTHEKGSPWDTIYNRGVGKRKIIPFELIKQAECGGLIMFPDGIRK